MSRKRLLLQTIFGVAVSAGAVGCGGNGPDTSGANDIEVREIAPMVRAACPSGDEEKLVDANRDGRANIRQVFQDGKELCVEIDLNLDGRIDVTRIFDDAGNLELEQHDFDFDGRLDQQAFYADGKMVRKELDTDFDNMIDTWLWCDGAAILRLERDRHHTGRVDTWETYKNGRLASINYDNNNDGRIERWETYRRGRLTEVRFDGDLDGKPDETQKQDFGDAGGELILEAVSCNGDPLPKLAEAAQAKPRSDPQAPPKKAKIVPADEASDDEAIQQRVDDANARPDTEQEEEEEDS